MPLFYFECLNCGTVTEQLVQPAQTHICTCGAKTKKMMGHPSFIPYRLDPEKIKENMTMGITYS